MISQSSTPGRVLTATPVEIINAALQGCLDADRPDYDYWPDLSAWAQSVLDALAEAGFMIAPARTSPPGPTGH